MTVILAAKTAGARPFRTRQEARTIARITIRNANDLSLSWFPGKVNLHSKREPATRLCAAYHEYGSVVDQYDKRASVHEWIIFRLQTGSNLVHRAAAERQLPVCSLSARNRWQGYRLSRPFTQNPFSPNSTDVSFALLRRSEQPTAVVHETICEQVQKAMELGTDSATSVPAAARLQTLSLAPTLSARSRIPVSPQCPSRPACST